MVVLFLTYHVDCILSLALEQMKLPYSYPAYRHPTPPCTEPGAQSSWATPGAFLYANIPPLPEPNLGPSPVRPHLVFSCMPTFHPSLHRTWGPVQLGHTWCFPACRHPTPPYTWPGAQSKDLHEVFWFHVLSPSPCDFGSLGNYKRRTCVHIIIQRTQYRSTKGIIASKLSP